MPRFRPYPLTIEAQPQDGGYLAYFPTLPGCQTWGETYEAAVRNAEEALAVFIETLIANGDQLPDAELNARPTALGIIVRTDIAA